MNTTFPRRIPIAGGEIVIADKKGQTFYDDVHYAPARRAGDYVYISGVVIARSDVDDASSFAETARTSFGRISAMLAAFDLTFDDVVMMNTFHDWTAAEFGGDRDAQFRTFCAVKDEIMPDTHPAWTAVGTSGLVSEDSIIEVQMIAYAPRS